MLEGVKKKWHSFNRDSKRAILAIMGLALLLSVVVIATVSKSASIREPKSENIWDEIRLPATVIPSHYDVKLKIDMTNERFTGSEEVLVDVGEATAVILLHINNVIDDFEGDEMNVTQYAVHKINDDNSVGSEIGVKHAFPYSPNSFFVMKMKQELQPGKYQLSFEWEARLVRGLDGIYISSYKEGDVDKKVLASQMEPLAARKVMPCFDEPDFKATFSMEITAEKIYPLVLWNMPQEGETVSVDDTWDKFVFEKSVEMSTYLLAFIVADFACTEELTTGNGVKVRTCGRRDPIAEKAGVYSAEMTKTIIEEYERFYGDKFPLPKIDSVAVPDFSAGAMENWGLILYRETALLYNPEKDTYGNKARVNVVVAHELAHQWFGNLVTMKWWNDLWLNEGFASYVEWIGTTASEPSWNYYDLRTYSDKSRAFAVDSYVSSRPASVPVEKPDDITAQFDTISYSKGSALLVQAKMFMDGTGASTENFEDAIKSYINLYKFDNAVQNDLYQQLNKVYKEVVDTSEDAVDIVEVMGTWTLQMNFPVLKVSRYDETRLAISQNRFLISGTDISGDKPSPYGYQWYVPVEYTVDDGDVEFEWLKPYSTVLVDFDFENEDSFIHLNKESAGYYIVDYSYDLNSRLRAHLKTKENYQKLTVSERQGMLYDAFLLISSGAKPISDGLDLIEIMSTDGFEEKLIPLREISRQISGVAVHISGVEEDNLPKKWKKKFTSFATSLFEKFGKAHFKESGAEDALPDGFQERMLATFAIQLGCAYGNDDCVKAAISKFNDYRDNDAVLSPSFKSTILQTVMSREPINDQIKSDWEFLWGKYMASDQATEKDVMYYALGLIQDREVLEKFSNLCLDPKLVRPSDALYILGRSIAQTKMGREVSWKFMKENWSRLTLEFSDALFAVDAYIGGVLSNFADQSTLDDIQTFFSDKLDSLASGRAAYETALQSIKGNIAWLDKHQSSVADFVKDVV